MGPLDDFLAWLADFYAIFAEIHFVETRSHCEHIRAVQQWFKPGARQRYRHRPYERAEVFAPPNLLQSTASHLSPIGAFRRLDSKIQDSRFRLLKPLTFPHSTVR
jgi:hypothetical protein